MVPISRVIMYLHFPGLWKKKRTKEALRREMDFHFTIDTFANKSRNKADLQVEFHNTFLIDTSSVRLGNFQTTISPTLRFVERSKSPRCFRQFVQNGLCQTKRRISSQSVEKRMSRTTGDKCDDFCYWVSQILNINWTHSTYFQLERQKDEEKKMIILEHYIFIKDLHWTSKKKKKDKKSVDQTDDWHGQWSLSQHKSRQVCFEKSCRSRVDRIFFWSYNKSIFTTVHFDENPFKC